MMKRTKELILLSLPFIAVPVFLFVGNRLSHSKNKANVDAYRNVVKTVYFEDTLVNYTLRSNSLVIEFQKPLEHTNWLGEIFIMKKGENGFVAHIEPPGKKDGYLGEIHFTNGKATFGGFQLSEDSLSSYQVLCHLVPHYPGCYAMGDIFPPYLFLSSDTIPNKLVINPVVKDFKVVTINMNQLKKLEPAARDFCRDSIEKAFGEVFSDVDITGSMNK